MRAELFAAGLVVLAAVAGVRHWESKGPAAAQAAEAAPSARPAQLAVARPAPAASRPYGAGGDEVRIAASSDSQFYVTAAVNDAPASFLVDTGAGYVALRDSDARKAGIHTSWTDFTHPVRTANGETKAALVEIAAIEIGRLRVEKVKALVLQDDQLGVNLLGMTFLSRLESVEARKGELLLRG